jgi:hypothetical protein
LWRSFADFLGKYWDEIQEEFGNDITLGQMNFALDPETDQIELSKSAYPAVTFQAKPDYPKEMAKMKMSVIHPTPARHTNITSVKGNIPCRFEIIGKEVVLQLNGQTFNAGQTAARFIIEKLLKPQ